MSSVWLKVKIGIVAALGIAIAIIKVLLGRNKTLKMELKREKTKLQIHKKTVEIMEAAREAEKKEIDEIKNARDVVELSNIARGVLFKPSPRKNKRSRPTGKARGRLRTSADGYRNRG